MTERNAGLRRSPDPDGRCKIFRSTSGESSDYAPISCPYVMCRLGRRFQGDTDRKSTRLNSSHLGISYAVFCLKKNKVGGCMGYEDVNDSERVRGDASALCI